MSITLSDGTTTVNLDDLHWSDELTYSPVKQSVDTSLTGSKIIQTAQEVEGQPITLVSVDESNAWIIRTDLLHIVGWAQTPGQELTLNIRSVNHTVIFRHHEPPAVEATPVVHFSDIGGSDWYFVALKFMEL